MDPTKLIFIAVLYFWPVGTLLWTTLDRRQEESGEPNMRTLLTADLPPAARPCEPDLDR